MIGYRRIPVSVPQAKGVDPSSTPYTISIPWDKYSENKGNLYLDIDPTGDPQVIINSDLNPLRDNRFLDLTFKPVIQSPVFGPVSNPVLRIEQVASVYVYKLEVFYYNDLPKGDNLEKAVPIYTFDDSQEGKILYTSLAKGGELAGSWYLYYCEYRNSKRTRALNINSEGTSTENTSWISFVRWVYRKDYGYYLEIDIPNRGTEVGDYRTAWPKFTYDPSKDFKFDWKDEIDEPFPEVSLSIGLAQNENKEEKYSNINFGFEKAFDEYWPPYYLPCIAGNTNYLYVNLNLSYLVHFSSESTLLRQGTNHSEVDIMEEGGGDNLAIDKAGSKVYFKEKNSSSSLSKVASLKASVGGTTDILQLTQAPDDGLIKASMNNMVARINTFGQQNPDSSYPKD